MGLEQKADSRVLYQMAAPELIDLPAVGSGKGVNVEETAALEPDVVILPMKLAEQAEQFEKLNIPLPCGGSGNAGRFLDDGGAAG